MTAVFERLRGALGRSVGVSILVLAALGSLPSVRALAAEQKTAEAPKPASAPPLAIPLADIATRSHRSIQLTRHSDDERSGQRGN